MSNAFGTSAQTVVCEEHWSLTCPLSTSKIISVMKINLSFLSLLTILFVGLKLTNHIDWSWWWVMSPMIAQLGLALMFVLLAIVVSFVKVFSK
jgi:hypothetical protein